MTPEEGGEGERGRWRRTGEEEGVLRGERYAIRSRTGSIPRLQRAGSEGVGAGSRGLDVRGPTPEAAVEKLLQETCHINVSLLSLIHI